MATMVSGDLTLVLVVCEYREVGSTCCRTVGVPFNGNAPADARSPEKERRGLGGVDEEIHGGRAGESERLGPPGGLESSQGPRALHPAVVPVAEEPAAVQAVRLAWHARL